MLSPVKERLIWFIKYKGISQRKFAEMCGLSSGFVNNIVNSIQPKTLSTISKQFPDLNTTWLLTGDGNMIKGQEPKIQPNAEILTDVTFYAVPLLPLSAQGGSLNDFVMSVKENECEKVLSPVKADFAMKVQGDSMSPAYPSGCTIYIKRINELIFIDWGHTYVLDTRNGTVIKTLLPSDKENAVKCVSLNPDPKFAPFDVSLSDVFGVYKVLAFMILF